MLRFVLFLVCSCATIGVMGQNPTRIWYFGEKIGLDFNSGKPVQLYDGQMTTNEGNATICDAQGKLLFYTDGVRVWNSQHDTMPSSEGMHGDYSSSQSAMIVPVPGSATQYYIFTIDADGDQEGVCYSIVDMSKEGGLGDVTTKNVKLYGPTAEKVTAAKHANGRDIWIITHGWGNNTFVAHLVTPTGVNSTPVTTNIGSTHSGFIVDSRGCMKASPDGTRLAVAKLASSTIELFTFDRQTGKVSNLINLPIPDNGGAYGLEFSPDSRYLYTSSSDFYSRIWQYDVKAGSAAAVKSSEVQVGMIVGSVGSMQIAPDGKIYFTVWSRPRMGTIENPNAEGLASTVKDSSVLFTRNTLWGLPNAAPYLFARPDFSFQNTCFSDETVFTVNDSTELDSAHWFFGEGMQGGMAMEKPVVGFSVKHTYTAPGTYTVKMIAFFGGNADTIMKPVTIKPKPEVDFPADTAICTGESFILDATNDSAQYLWHDGSTGPTFNVDEAGTYWVTVTRNGCTATDTIVVQSRNGFAGLGKDTTLCNGEPVTLEASTPNSTYLWSTGSTDSVVTVSLAGVYWVEVSNGCGKKRDSIEVQHRQAPAVDLGEDVFACDELSVLLNAAGEGVDYQWSTGSTDSTILVTEPGTYWVKVSNACGTAFDTVVVQYSETPVIDFGPDTTLCLDRELVLDAEVPGGAYVWSTGTTGSAYTVTEPGIYWVSATSECGTSGDTIKVDFQDCECHFYVPNAFTPNEDINNEVFKTIGCNAKYFHMQVYNRWGQLLWETYDINEGWDGKFKSEVCQQDVYLYIIKARDFFRKPLQMSGTVHLIR